MMPEIPVERVGSPVDESGARLVRSRFTDGQPVAAQITAAHVHGNSKSGNEIVIADREQLRQLFLQLQGCYYGWPGGER